MIKKAIYLMLLAIFSFMAVEGQIDTLIKPDKKTGKSSRSFYLFGRDDVLDISIRFDLTDYLKKKDIGTAVPAEVIFNPDSPDSIAKNVTITTRGNFRLENCYFAPMDITFKKPVPAYSDSLKIKKVKLVSACDFGNHTEEYVLREYLVYKMYNVISDTSFRVRLLRVTYIDTKRSRKPVTLYGFFIEPKYVMASRLRTVVVKSMNLNQRHIEPHQMDIVSIFNYMVGDWDWAVQSQHNIVILKSLVYGASELGIAVPYDFDLTGVVDPDYNSPPESLGLHSNRDRRFVGLCRSREIYLQELKWFAGKKEKLNEAVNNFQYLSQRSRKDIIAYIDNFFQMTERPKSMENLIGLFLNSCVK